MAAWIAAFSVAGSAGWSTPSSRALSALLYMVNQLGAAFGIAAAALIVATAGAVGPAFWLLVLGVAVGLVASTALPGRQSQKAPAAQVIT